MQKKVGGAGVLPAGIATYVQKNPFFEGHQTSQPMSVIIETRHNIMEMLFQLDSVEALLQVEQQIREVLSQTSSAEDYRVSKEVDAASVSEPVAVHPDLSAPEYQVAESVDLDMIMEPDGRTTEEIKQDWASLSDAFSHISEEETNEFIETD